MKFVLNENNNVVVRNDDSVTIDGIDFIDITDYVGAPADKVTLLYNGEHIYHIFDEDSNNYKSSEIYRYLHSGEFAREAGIYIDYDSIDLLSVEEAEKLPKSVKYYKNYWWLRSPGFNSYYAAVVHITGPVHYYGNRVDDMYDAVRPTLVVDANLLNRETQINENSGKYRRVKRSLFGDSTGKIKTFAIISSENPLGWKNSTKEEFIKKYNAWLNDKRGYNKNSHTDFRSDIKDIRLNGERALKIGNFAWTPIKGSYGDKEKSYMIFNLSINDAKTLAKNFGQESFFFGKVYEDNSHIAYYETSNACETYNLIEITDKVTDESDASDFFSKFGFKYRINLRYFGDDVPSIENNGEFEESMDENRTFMSRSIHRRKAFGENYYNKRFRR